MADQTAEKANQLTVDQFVGTVGNMMDDPDSKEGKALVEYAKGLKGKYPNGGLKKEEFAAGVLKAFPDLSKHFQIQGLPSRTDAPALPGEDIPGSFTQGLFTGLPELATGKSLQQRYHDATESDKGGDPTVRFIEGAEEKVLGLADSLMSPAALIMGGAGKLFQAGSKVAEAAPAIAKYGRAASRMIAPLFTFKSGKEAYDSYRDYEESKDPADLGRAFSSFFAAGAGATESALESRRGGVFGARESSAPAEAPAARAAEAPPGSPALPSADRLALPAPSQGALPHEAVQDIAAGAGPFRQQAHEWSMLPREDLERMQAQAQAEFKRISGHLAGETAPFKEGRALPPELQRKVNDAKAKADVLDKLVNLKRKYQFGGWEREVSPGGSPSGTPMPGEQQRRIGGPPSDRSGPPGAGPFPNPTGRSEPPPGPGGRLQIGEGSNFGPQPEWSTTLEWAKKLPPNTLTGMVDRMRTAATQQAMRLHQEAGQDPDKLEELKQFLESAKSRIDQMAKLLPKEAKPAAESKKTTAKEKPAKSSSTRSRWADESEAPPGSPKQQELPLREAPAREPKTPVGQVGRIHTANAQRAISEAKTLGIKRAMLEVLDSHGNVISQVAFNPEGGAESSIAEAMAKGLAKKVRVSSMNGVGKKVEFNIEDIPEPVRKPAAQSRAVRPPLAASARPPGS